MAITAEQKFKRVDSIAESISKINSSDISLNLKSYLVPDYPSTLSMKEFTQTYQKKFPDSVLFTPRYNTIFQVSQNFDPFNFYYSARVCYKKEERLTSSGRPYPKKKTNTYILCPICEPFQKRNSSVYYSKREGKLMTFDSSEPRFYDTLHSSYDHHMNYHHGVLKDGSVVPQPLIGFINTGTEFELYAICPSNEKYGSKSPCLGMFKLNLFRNGGFPFKSYIRHYVRYHKGRFKSVEMGKEVYQGLAEDGKPNTIIPVSSKCFSRQVEALKRICPDTELHFLENSELIDLDYFDDLLPELELSESEPEEENDSGIGKSDEDNINSSHSEEYDKCVTKTYIDELSAKFKELNSGEDSESLQLVLH